MPPILNTIHKYFVWGLPSEQHVWPYQHDERSATVRTNGDLVVLRHCDISPVSHMTQYLTQSHYADAKETSPCPMLLLPKAR